MGLLNQPAIEHDIIPPSLAIRAMKDNGYRNMAYGIAELVDNSIQAGSKNVRIIIMEDEVPLAQRTRTRAVQIAVVDDGCGMTREGLQSALQFGNGSRLNDRSGIGRFGVGLPNSSINFCEHLQVWSWQDEAMEDGGCSASSCVSNAAQELRASYQRYEAHEAHANPVRLASPA